MIQDVDLIVIGAGPGGYEVAAHEVASGKKVVVIEKDLLGGTCLNRGCIPTKCLCAGADALHAIEDAAQFGVKTSRIEASYAEALLRSKDVVATLRDGIRSLLSKCTLIEGEAVIHADGSVWVEDNGFKAPKVIIATGSKPAGLHIKGCEYAVNSDEFLEIDQLPKKIVIVGGGVIGMEFAYIAKTYGSEVTVIEYCKEILPPFDAEVAKRLRLSLVSTGLSIETSAKVSEIRKKSEKLEVLYTDKKGEQCVEADMVIMAVGRSAVVPDGLSDAGIQVNERGFIVTDGNMETTRPGFYAVGDCNGRLMLAHVATAQSMLCIGQNINLDVVPSAVFVRPEIAMVGLTTEQCKEKGLEYVTKKALYRANGKALASGHSEGFVKVLVSPATGEILGCHILGAHASDLIQEVVLAMAHGLSAEQVAKQTIHGHPTLSEIIASALG